MALDRRTKRTARAAVEPAEPEQTPDPQIRLVFRDPRALKRNPKNARLHPKNQIKALVKSIRALGFKIPVGIDDQDNLVFGHCRTEAACQAGLSQIPCIRISDLTPYQARALALAENKIAELATWDEALLAHHFLELSAANIEFDLDVTGFEIPEIDLIIENHSASTKPESDAADVVPPFASGPAVSKLGDVFQLGPHKLLVGNARSPESHERLMGAKKAVCAFEDFPYNCAIADFASGLGRVKHADFVEAAGEMSDEEFERFLDGVCALICKDTTPGGVHFLCMDYRNLRILLNVVRRQYTELKNIVTWVKDRAGMGSFYRSQTEFIVVAKSGKGPNRNNIQLGRFGRDRSNAWFYPAASSFSKASDEGNLLHAHPTVKNLRMVCDAILDVTKPGEIVLDTFLGSGTTLIAAERTRRTCYGMELDCRYADLAIRRWQSYTGHRAQHESSGVLFDKLAAKKGARHGAK